MIRGLAASLAVCVGALIAATPVAFLLALAGLVMGYGGCVLIAAAAVLAAVAAIADAWRGPRP